MIFIDNEYMTGIRRELHMYPEVDFDLPKTVALIKRELESMGVEYTEKYGKGSVVGYINPDKTDFTIGIRADTDALKIVEQTGAPYASKHEGMMHACGHDAHTAMLLGTAKALKEMEKDLNCRVLLIFQPSEEGLESGAMMMIDNGIIDEIDIIIAQHVSPGIEVGGVSYKCEYSNASSRHVTIDITGKSAHAASPQTGIDALAVATRLYTGLHVALNREVSPSENYICSINSLVSGTAANIVPDKALLKGTIRTFDVGLSELLFEKIKKIAKGLEVETGATINVHGPLKSVPLYNNPELCRMFAKSAEKVVGSENVTERTQKGYGSEDFSRFLYQKPGMIFRLGVGNKAKNITNALHHSDFDLDESALKIGCSVFVQFVLDNQNGVDIEKIKNSDTRGIL